MAWIDNFNIIYSKELKIDDTHTWKFQLEEHKTKGTLHMNVRLFKKTDNYNGPTKNGFIQQINSIEQLENFRYAFEDYFKEIRNKL